MVIHISKEGKELVKQFSDYLLYDVYKNIVTIADSIDIIEIPLKGKYYSYTEAILQPCINCSNGVYHLNVEHIGDSIYLNKGDSIDYNTFTLEVEEIVRLVWATLWDNGILVPLFKNIDNVVYMYSNGKYVDINKI